jgi:hypothetical protein
MLDVELLGYDTNMRLRLAPRSEALMVLMLSQRCQAMSWDLRYLLASAPLR